MKVWSVLMAVAVALLASACTSWEHTEGTYQYFEVIHDTEWSAEDEFFFSTDILQSGLSYDVRLVLRLDRDMKYLSLPIGITFETPQRKLESYEITVPIQRYSLGQGGFNIVEQSTLIRKGVTFPTNGVYTYSIRHLCTDSIVSGVVEVGLLIEPSQK